jgi:hypothetical protein
VKLPPPVLAAVVILALAPLLGCKNDHPTVPTDAGSGAPRALDGAADRSLVIPEGGAPGDATAGYLPMPEVVSGTRLKGLYVQAENGVHDRWLWDDELQTICESRQAEDGSLRCLPKLELRAQMDGVETVYRDAACTEPLFPENAACTKAYGYRKAKVGYAIFSLGPAETPAAAFRLGASGCEPVSGPLKGRYFTAGATLAPDRFVLNTGERAVGPPGQRIHRMMASFADGAMVLEFVFRDTATNGDCQIFVAADGVPRCLPLNVSPGVPAIYSDDQCTRRVAVSLAGRPAPLLVATDGSCPQVTRVFEPGARLAPDQLYEKARAGCVPHVDDNPDLVFSDRGAEVSPARYAPFREVEGPPGRIQQRHYVNEDGVAVRASQSDSQTGDRCLFVPTAKGWRCLPLEGSSVGFADAACGTPLATPLLTPCSTQSREVPSSTRVGPWCTRQFAPVKVGAMVASGYAHQADGQCVATGKPGLASELLDPADFAPGDQFIR